MDERPLQKAQELVVKHNKATTTFLQRHLMIDYERATRLMEILQTNGVIGPALGANPRKIFFVGRDDLGK